MLVYLAGLSTSFFHMKEVDISNTRLLDSYFYMFKRPDLQEKIIYGSKPPFLLDSGAFSFMSGKTINQGWESYLRDYISFINKYDINLFFELDIDAVVGHDKVLDLRKQLEDGTGKKCIPVWHKSRGKEEWFNLIESYDYVAIGGLVAKFIKQSEHKYLPWFLQTARKQKTKVHCLGYTATKSLDKYPFYSIDSTSWTSANRYGEAHTFNGKHIERRRSQKGQRAIYEKLVVHNFKEWTKYANHMEKKQP